MKRKRSLGGKQLQVLEAVASGTGYGFDIMERTRLPSGTVYPALGRLEKTGLVRSKWERATIAHEEKRPPRRYYEVTREGRAALEQALVALRNRARSLAKTVRQASSS